MKTILLSIALFAAFGQSAFAKEGIIVKGENGTKWCCPDGVKSDHCEKGASTIPVGANCNFASKTVVPTGKNAIVRK